MGGRFLLVVKLPPFEETLHEGGGFLLRIGDTVEQKPHNWDEHLKHMQRLGRQQTRADLYGILCEREERRVVRIHRGFVPPNGGKKGQLVLHGVAAKRCGHPKLNQHRVHQIVAVSGSEGFDGVKLVVPTQQKKGVGDQTVVRVQRPVEEEGIEQRRLVCRHRADGYDNASECAEEKARVGRLGRAVEELEQRGNHLVHGGIVTAKKDRQEQCRLCAAVQAVCQQPQAQLRVHLATVREHLRQTRQQLRRLRLGEEVVGDAIEA